MDDTINYNEYIDYSPDDNIWLPIPQEEYVLFDSLIGNVQNAYKSGSKKEKGDTLEDLMTYVYGRFKHKKVYHNIRSSDNQIDHVLEFIDGITPSFINQHIGLRLIGESKNHNKSIGSREVNNLDELLRDKKSKLGIFSSYKSFSQGKTMWVNAEGKRRKLALWNCYERIVIGFTIAELATLKSNNFYTMLKQKYNQIIDELEDDHTDNDLKLPYQYRLYYSMLELHKKGLINDEAVVAGKEKIESQYGVLDLHD
ncbi:restriction endonuclease [Domibacillus tundrae]|uniref:restriction endonuclease n=1 Tax=Domibacillus tundrae TaxID=1587527 RepID=UPI000617CC7F|nr:restriction endonuclease [Domibacillus tundrae]